jgi:hypothetical protein
MAFNLPDPALQIDFASRLLLLRESMLQESLLASVARIAVSKINRQLEKHAPASGLKALASRGIRGELLFSVPCLFELNPRLLGYYRLLLGYSQKAFYGSECGLSVFRSMEESGVFSTAAKTEIEDLCQGLNIAAGCLLKSLPPTAISAPFLDHLTLLTLGPQLRGGANVKKGCRGIAAVFEILREIVQSCLKEATPSTLILTNPAGRNVRVALGSDPDIVITEAFSDRSGGSRLLIAIEVKSGTDFSNIHNRIGEAEKSHQKARRSGFTECWTVVNVEKINLALARRESPSTDRFYRLERLLLRSGEEFSDFKNRVLSLTGVPSKSRSKPK